MRRRVRQRPNHLLKHGAGNETRTRDPDLGKVVLYQLSYSRAEPAILLSTAGLSTTRPSSARKTGHAARRYSYPDHSVSSAAIASSQSPTWKTNDPIHGMGCGGFAGLIAYSRQNKATICAIVLILPTVATATRARWPSSAIHSRNAETAISRPTITAAHSAIHAVGWPCTIRNNAVATINLSATGSRNAPNAEYCL